LGAAAHGAREVEQRAHLRASGEDERAQGRQLLLPRVDGVLQPLDVVGRDGGLRLAIRDAGLGVGELRAEGEEVLLHLAEERVHLRVLPAAADESEAGVQLVHRAVALHAQAVLADARAVAESRLALVARLRVDLHGAPNGRATTLAGAPATSTALPGSERVRWR